MRMRATLSAFALIAVAATSVEAQQAQNPIEFGVDGQISFGLDDQGTDVMIPRKVRAGFVISPTMTIEPSFAFIRDGHPNGSTSVVDVDVSLLYHFSTIRTANQFYVRPVIGVQRASFSTDTPDISTSNTDLNIGVAGGIKIPLMDRVGARFEAEFRNYMSDPSVSALNLNFGLSYFTR